MIQKNVLEDLGLSEKEAKVYLALLELGASPVQKIATKAGVNRATTYVCLEHLRELSLVSTVKRGVKDFFIAESPEQLKVLIEKQQKEIEIKKEELNKIIVELKKTYEYAGERPVVRFYDGIEGIRFIEEDFVNSLKNNDSGVGFVAQDQLMEVLPKFISNYTAKRIKKKIKLKTIYTNKNGPIKNATNPRELRSTVYVDKKEMPYNTSITIYSDKLVVTSLSGKLVGMIIEHKDIAKTFYSIFEMAFKYLEEKEKKKK